MYMQTQFSIFLVNKPGVLSAVTEALGKAHVNIIALTVMDSIEHGVLRIVTDDVVRARNVLSLIAEQWTEASVVSEEIPNRPGAFADIARKLSDSHINIAYAYCTGGSPRGKTMAIFKVADPKKAMKIFPGKQAKAVSRKKTAQKKILRTRKQI